MKINTKFILIEITDIISIKMSLIDRKLPFLKIASLSFEIVRIVQNEQYAIM